jgi:hypothetical protein
MQLKKKTSKKTAAAAEATAPIPESVVAPEAPTKPRASKSSKAKKTEGIDMTSGKRHHKLATPAATEAPLTGTPLPVVAKPIKDTPARAIGKQQIAELAYSYWISRGQTHGSAEHDWLRAEQELSGL